MAKLIGNKANQVSTNGMLGDVAFMSKESLVIKPKVLSEPSLDGDLCFEYVDDTHLKLNIKGYDGTIRYVILPMADFYKPIGGATGAPDNPIFYENDTNVTGDYTITVGSNAMSAGPITIDAGVTVTVPSGSRWTVV